MDLPAFTAFPHEIWRQIWSNNPQERLNKEIRRRTDVVGIFPDRPSLIRLVGAVLAERNDEWAEGRRYMGLEILAELQRTGQEPEPTAEPTALQAGHQDDEGAPRAVGFSTPCPLHGKLADGFGEFT